MAAMLARLLLGITEPKNSTNRYRLAFKQRRTDGEPDTGYQEYIGPWIKFPLSVDNWDVLQRELQSGEWGPTALLVAVTPMEPKR